MIKNSIHLTGSKFIPYSVYIMKERYKRSFYVYYFLDWDRAFQLSSRIWGFDSNRKTWEKSASWNLSENL